MNKRQLIEAVSDQLGSRTIAQDAVDAVLDAMVRAVVAGERVQVTGFGTLEPVQRSARYARNPQTGERVRVKKTTTPRFRPGQGFKDLVSGARKLPKQGPSIMKAPKGSLTPGGTTTTTTKRGGTKRTTAVTTSAPAKKAATARTAAKKTSAAKPAAARKTATPARKTTTTVSAKRTTPAKQTARRAAR